MITTTFDAAFDQHALRAAFNRVRSNNGCAGADGVSISDFELSLSENLRVLEDDLLSARYKPKRLLAAKIKKPDGGLRQLRIPSVRDRIAQTALLNTIVPQLDSLFHQNSFAYRPGRGVKDALNQLAVWNAKDCWIVDIDISTYFDSIDHNRLKLDLTFWIKDQKSLRLMMIWLKNFSAFGRGVAQGSPISPFFSNVFLHPVDCLLDAQGIRAVRYADDVLILARSRKQAQTFQNTFERLLRQRGLRKNEQKSSILQPGEPFVYLGKKYGNSSELISSTP